MANWTPERVVDAPAAARLVAEQFPEFAGAAAEPFGAGFDNTAFLVGGAWVFRFPRRAVAVPWLLREIRVLPLVATHVPLPVPAPAYVGEPTDAFPWPFAGYRRLDGRTACSAALDDAARTRAAPVLGAFLAALHAIPAADAEALGARDDEKAKLDIENLAPEMRDLATEHIAAGTLPPATRDLVERVLADADGITPLDGPLSHGDLYARHLLVDDAGDLSGVIDWGDLHLCDPGCDLSVAHLFLPRSAHDAFRRAYGRVDEPRWRLARLRAVFHAMATARFCVATGDGALLRECRFAIASQL